VRDTNDFSGVRREAAWILGCIAAAVGFCYLAPEYGYDPVPFLSLLFYGLTALVRFVVRALLRLLRDGSN
jgi:hypothetical protein